ncbi:hypothetical protein IFO70_35295 [Phormidium tenue FACHB-886]|nr:hypothetical protein [Phormidium tenue FACHB-886]
MPHQQAGFFGLVAVLFESSITDSATGVRHYSPSHQNGPALIHHAYPDDAKTIPYDGCVQAQIQPFPVPLGEGLPNQGVMSGNDINASIRRLDDWTTIGETVFDATAPVEHGFSRTNQTH